MAAEATFMKGKGCNHCQKSGYRGRVGIFELMPVTAKIRELTFDGASSQVLRKAAVADDMVTLYQDGIRKALMRDHHDREDLARRKREESMTTNGPITGVCLNFHSPSE